MFLTNQLLAVFLFVVSLIAITITYFKWTFKYWEKKGVETLKPTIPFGNAADMFFKNKHFGEIWQLCYNNFREKGLSYGGGYFFTRKVFVPTDLELIKCILQKDFQHFVNRGRYFDEKEDPLSGHLFSLDGEKWKTLRIKLTPTFSSAKMRMMFDIIKICAENLKCTLNKSAGNSEPVNTRQIMGCFATDVVGSAAFGIECNSLENPNSEFCQYGRMFFEHDFKEFIVEIIQEILPRKFLRFMKYKIIKPKVEKFFLNLVKKTVDFREKNNIHRKDFMQLLIQLKNMGKVTDDGKILESEKTEKGTLTLNEVAAQACVFFVAGYETASLVVTLALFELALNQDIQEKLREEINSVLKTLRKFPPAPNLLRICNKEYKVPNSNLIIKEGTTVAISVTGIHRDHEYYPNPLRFDPERFSEKNKRSRPSFAFMPFGEGQRICIAFRFALLEIKVALATILQELKFSLNRKTSLPLKFDNKSIVLRPFPIWLDVKKIE